MAFSLDVLKLKDWNSFELVRLDRPYTRFTDMPNEACFIYVFSGRLRTRTPVTEFYSEGRDALLLKCGHYIGDILVEGEEYEALVVHLYPEMIRELFEEGIRPDIQASGRAVFSATISKDQILEKFAESMRFYFENPQLVDNEILSLKIKELILILLKMDEHGLVRQLMGTLFDPVAISFKEVVENHVYTDISQEKLAFLTGRSLASFKRDFQKFYQTSFSEYFKRRKLEKAARLLTDTDQRVQEILLDCGWVNASHFTRSFKETYGKSPTEYRLSSRAK